MWTSVFPRDNTLHNPAANQRPAAHVSVNKTRAHGKEIPGFRPELTQSRARNTCCARGLPKKTGATVGLGGMATLFSPCERLQDGSMATNNVAMPPLN